MVLLRFSHSLTSLFAIVPPSSVHAERFGSGETFSGLNFDILALISVLILVSESGRRFLGFTRFTEST